MVVPYEWGQRKCHHYPLKLSKLNKIFINIKIFEKLNKGSFDEVWVIQQSDKFGGECRKESKICLQHDTHWWVYHKWMDAFWNEWG